jgi:hypothetical protein
MNPLLLLMTLTREPVCVRPGTWVLLVFADLLTPICDAVFRMAPPDTALVPPTLRVSVVRCPSSTRYRVSFSASRTTIDYRLSHVIRKLLLATRTCLLEAYRLLGQKLRIVTRDLELRFVFRAIRVIVSVIQYKGRLTFLMGWTLH